MNKKRLFIASDLLTELWEKTGLSEEDLRDFQNKLLENPKAGTVI